MNDLIENLVTKTKLWTLLYKYEEAPTNSTGSAVVGTGDDSSTVKVKKKKKVLKRKKMPDLKGTYLVGQKPDAELRRNLKMSNEDTEVKPETSITPDATFAQMPVFKVSQDEFAKCKDVKKKYERWNKHIDTESEYGKKIHTYAKKNPKKSIIVQDDKSGHMVYLKKYSQVEK